MLLDQRRHGILQAIEREGFAALHQLVELSGASESTVRRDLEYLEKIGQIRRTRGGAAYVGESISALDERAVKAHSQKELIGRTAAALVENGEAILLDGGTTTFEVARHLNGKSLQIVTNSLPIVQLLSNQPHIELLMIGGYLFPKTGVALGPLAVSALEQIHVRRLFMGVSGITERGLFNSNTLLVETERAMMSSAEEVIVVTDSTKLGHSALAHLSALDAIDRVIVDDGISPEWQETFAQAGVMVTIATADHKADYKTDGKKTANPSGHDNYE